jgi:hypothetical protein
MISAIVPNSDKVHFPLSLISTTTRKRLASKWHLAREQEDFFLTLQKPIQSEIKQCPERNFGSTETTLRPFLR